MLIKKKKKKTAKANNTIFDMDLQNKIIIRCVVIYRLFFYFWKNDDIERG